MHYYVHRKKSKPIPSKHAVQKHHRSDINKHVGGATKRWQVRKKKLSNCVMMLNMCCEMMQETNQIILSTIEEKQKGCRVNHPSLMSTSSMNPSKNQRSQYSYIHLITILFTSLLSEKPCSLHRCQMVLHRADFVQLRYLP